MNIYSILVLTVLTGCGVLLPNASKFDSIKSACAEGKGAACYSLGLMYSKGIGTEKSDYQAREAYKRGCKKANNKNACSELGKMEVLGLGKNRDDYSIKTNISKEQNISTLDPKQLENSKSACAQGDGEACYRLGQMYSKGIGVEKNYAQATTKTRPHHLHTASHCPTARSALCPQHRANTLCRYPPLRHRDSGLLYRARQSRKERRTRPKPKRILSQHLS